MRVDGLKMRGKIGLLGLREYCFNGSRSEQATGGSGRLKLGRAGQAADGSGRLQL